MNSPTAYKTDNLSIKLCDQDALGCTQALAPSKCSLLCA